MVIVQSILKCLELFLMLKNKLFYYEIVQKSKSRQKELLDEIEKLRSFGDSNSADRADILRMQLQNEKAELQHLSAFYAEATKGPTNSNR